MSDEIEVSAAMIRAGLEALREESFRTPQEDVVSLVYMAMEYQRRHDEFHWKKK